MPQSLEQNTLKLNGMVEQDRPIQYGKEEFGLRNSLLLFAVLGVLMITPLCRFSGSGRGKSFRRRPCDVPPNLFPLCVPLQTGGEAEEYCFAVSLVFSDVCH